MKLNNIWFRNLFLSKHEHLMKTNLQSSTALRSFIAFMLFVGVLPLYSQTNLAPSATVSGFGGGQAPYQWTMINDLNFGTCGTQQAFVWTATPPDGSEWMQWEW